MMCDDRYDFDGCVRLLGAVIRQEIRDAYNDPYRLRRVADWLGMPLEDLQARWQGRKDAHSMTYGVKRSDFNGKQ